MKQIKDKRTLPINNDGFTLIELLIVVSILSIVVGTASVGLSLANSRDAEKCAKLIDAGLEETRMNSLSRKGTYKLVLDLAVNKLEIVSSVSGLESVQDLPDRVVISLESEGARDLSANTKLTVEFDKSTGKIKMIDSSGAGDISLIKIKSENSNGKKAVITLSTATGKHFVNYNS